MSIHGDHPQTPVSGTPVPLSVAEEIAIIVGRAGQADHHVVQRLVALVERERQKVHDFHDFLNKLEA